MAESTAQRPTFAEVNLDNLADNFHASKQFVGNAPKYLAVVKANAYGHGAIECSKRLAEEGVDWLGVAVPEEGVHLREAGITTPILCLGSFWAGQESLLIENDLTPVIFDLDRAASLSQAAATLDRDLDIHVKIDTGMGRAGVRHDEIATFVDALSRFKDLAVTGLMTHFAAADDPAQDEFTRLQIARFESACDAFIRAGYEPMIFDLANSPGAISYAESRGSMVRLGGALYGLLDDILRGEAPRPNLKPVLSLRSRIAHVTRIPKGESLGYGRTFTTAHDSLIALVPIGYADGYSRALSNKGRAIVNGRLVRVVGRVSMDWTLLDITDVAAKADDEVIFIGSDGQNEITAADLAREIGTIGYEITCGISARVPRTFK